MTSSEYKEIDLQSGQVLFRENDTAKNVYLVKSGILIGLKNADNRLVKVGQFLTRDFIGIVNIFEGRKYSESVIAETDAKLIVLPANEISLTIKNSPEWISKLLFTITGRLESGLDLLAEHKINDEQSGEFHQELEAKYRKFLKE